MQKTIKERSYPSCPCSSSIKDCAAMTSHGTNDTNVGVLCYLGIDVVISLLARILTKHRQVICVHIYIYYFMHIKLT